MKKHEEIRKEVSNAYAKAVSRSTSSDSGCGCGTDYAPEGLARKLAGYTREQLEALPADAVVNSFGCGNPVAFSEIKDGEVILDLGSGAGIDILLAGKKVGPKGRVIGIDMTDEMIARAEKNIKAAGLDNVEVRKGIIEDMPVESSSVDWVISNCVINLSPEKDRVFAEIARVLKPGGRMLVSDIVAKDLPDWVRLSSAFYSSCIGGAISEDEYIKGLEKAGLDNVEVRERLFYDTSLLKGLLEADQACSAESRSCCNIPIDPDKARKVIEELDGKIWSAKFHARKP
jgi:arsenite methyltransferase